MGAIAFCQLQWCDDEWPNILRFWITARLLEVWRDERYNRFPIRRRVFMMLNWFPSLPPRFGISSRSSHATIKQTRMERFYYCKTNKYFSFFSQNYQSRNGGHFFVKSWMTLLKTIFPEYYPKKEGSKKSYRSLSGFTFHNYPLPFHSPLRIPIRIPSDSISLKSFWNRYLAKTKAKNLTTVWKNVNVVLSCLSMPSSLPDYLHFVGGELPP